MKFFERQRQDPKWYERFGLHPPRWTGWRKDEGKDSYTGTIYCLPIADALPFYLTVHKTKNTDGAIFAGALYHLPRLIETNYTEKAA